MAYLSLTQEMFVFRRPVPGPRLRAPVALFGIAALETLSIGSFLCVCLALIAAFS